MDGDLHIYPYSQPHAHGFSQRRPSPCFVQPAGYVSPAGFQDFRPDGGRGIGRTSKPNRLPSWRRLPFFVLVGRGCRPPELATAGLLQSTQHLFGDSLVPEPVFQRLPDPFPCGSAPLRGTALKSQIPYFSLSTFLRGHCRVRVWRACGVAAALGLPSAPAGRKIARRRRQT